MCKERSYARNIHVANIKSLVQAVEPAAEGNTKEELLRLYFLNLSKRMSTRTDHNNSFTVFSSLVDVQLACLDLLNRFCIVCLLNLPVLTGRQITMQVRVPNQHAAGHEFGTDARRCEPWFLRFPESRTSLQSLSQISRMGKQS